jgi:hypothetical protein
MDYTCDIRKEHFRRMLKKTSGRPQRAITYYFTKGWLG